MDAWWRWPAEWRDGRVKQAVIAAALAIRAADPALFARGEYVPVEAEGIAARHVIAFARRFEGRAAIVAVPRLPWGLLRGSEGILIPGGQLGGIRRSGCLRAWADGSGMR